MNIDLKGLNALVGGSTAGIGQAIAERLAAAGATVTLLARNEAKCKEVLNLLNKNIGQQHDYILADQTLPLILKETLDHYLADHSKTFHIVINNTGGPSPGPLHQAATSELEKAFSQHVIASHLIMQTCLPGMKKAGYGRIINVISTSVKAPLPNLGVSNTIRAAMANWSKTLATELAPFGITVNNILPGATDTDRLRSIIETKASKSGKSADEIRQEMIGEIPAGRFGLPREIAAAAVFLASPEAAYITGINVPVDGGRTPSL
ncbi:3-oxoacyl-ACP reductase [Thermaurantimonas aggregans]|uniref:3-oxoacyl-ACP reductase n=1 Tax=Thermaurantimonas aggregans TaxID=2173829 RepID=A0A401XHZ0_9FLAO|nr:SDR family oxidoreductase [Thermaurantimonas aggregans]MCX8149182.1 SDR family oxidoreductase [Thermaurantimonas aggregans]GCD76623.1 3-oxoacyl-ACP reductase [Thermaurantimonas aggregans]